MTTSDETPRWVRLIDGVAALVAAALVWKIVSADTRAGIFTLIPHVHTSVLFYVLAGLVVVRHIIFPRPTTFARVRDGWRSLTAGPHWGPAIRAFIATRLGVFLVAFFSIATLSMPNPGVVLTSDPLTNLPMRFDAGWYGGIAINGYDPDVNFKRHRNIAFFPAMPLLMRAVGPVFGSTQTGVPEERRMARALWTGVFLSLCAFLLALCYVVRLAADVVGEEHAASAALLLAAYPFACFFNAPYTESLFLLGTVAAAYHFRREQWWAAGAWGFLTGLTRPNGFLLSVPLGLLALAPLVPWGRKKLTGTTVVIRPLVAASMPVGGMLAFSAYLFSLTGIWFAWARSHEAWGRSFTGLEPISRGISWVLEEGIVDAAMASPFNFLNTVAAVFALLMLWPVARRVGLAWALYMIMILVPPILAGGALSLGRVTSTLFPMFLALAAVVPSRTVPSVAAAFAVGQGLCTALFFTWRELY